MQTIEEQTFERHQKALLTLAGLARQGQTGLEAVCEAGADALEVAQFGIWLLDKGGDSIVCRALFRLDGRTCESGMELFASDFPGYFEAVKTARAIVACDAMTHEATREFALEYLPAFGIGAMLDAPILGAEGMRGVICCEHVGGAREWTRLEQLTAASLADRVALLLQQEEILTAMEAAKHALAVRDDFLSHMSHELRTPMVGVLSVAELLASSDLDPEPAEHVSTIHRCSKSLLQIVDDILDLSRVESGRLSLKPQPTDLCALFDEVAALFQDPNEDVGNVLTITVADSVDCHVTTDPVRLRQILLNLVGNATKFTRCGTVAMGATLNDLDGEPRLSIHVEDSGIGMDAAQLEGALEIFTRGQRAGLSGESGSGLGLAISQRLVGLMGGRLTVKSVPGEGTRCTLDLPYECSRSAAEPAPASQDIKLRLAPGLRVLFAEDNKVNQRIIGLMLKKIGCDVTTVDDGQKAVAAVESAPYDAVLMDCQMPRMDGFEATQAIRALQGGIDLPVIALTAHARDDHRGLCEAAGMSDFLSKPASMADLATTLAKWDRRVA